MTREEERDLLREYLAVCARIQRGFAETIKLAEAMMPATAEQLDALSPSDETLVLAFLKRFEQFEDTLQRTLKAISKVMEHGRIERLTSVDVARRAYGLGILDSEQAWSDAVRVRNALAHEYPLNPEKRAAQVNAAWSMRDRLTTTLAAIHRFVEVEGLLL